MSKLITKLRSFSLRVKKWNQKLKLKIDEVMKTKIVRLWDLTAFICAKVGDSYLAVRKESVKKLDPWVQCGDWLYYINLHNPTVEFDRIRLFFMDSETGQVLPFIDVKEKLLDKSILDEILHTKTARNLTIQTGLEGRISLTDRIAHIFLGVLIGFMVFYFLAQGGII